MGWKYKVSGSILNSSFISSIFPLLRIADVVFFFFLNVCADPENIWKHIKQIHTGHMDSLSITQLIAKTSKFLRSIAKVNIPRTDQGSVLGHEIKIVKQRLKRGKTLVEPVPIIDIAFYILYSMSMYIHSQTVHT